MDVADLVDAGTEKVPSSSPRAKPLQRLFANKYVKSILREPLIHFLALGFLLFFYFHWKGGSSGPSTNRIVITRAQIEQLAVGFARTWQRPPSETELKGLIDEYVKEEIATREAIEAGLDRDDVIIRRRLRQKLEFIAEDTVQAKPPGDAELQAWLDKHPGEFRSEPKVAFRQVYLSAQRHGTSLRSDATKLLARLKAAGPNVPITNLGDPTMLPQEQPLAALFETSRSFGDEFAKELMNAEPGQWVGPLESSFGLHLVLISEKVLSAQQPLSAVRVQVEREVRLERKNQELQTLYNQLLEKYTVKIELPLSPSAGTAK